MQFVFDEIMALTAGGNIEAAKLAYSANY